jgi:hypothetical protein
MKSIFGPPAVAGGATATRGRGPTFLVVRRVYASALSESPSVRLRSVMRGMSNADRTIAWRGKPTGNAGNARSDGVAARPRSCRPESGGLRRARVGVPPGTIRSDVDPMQSSQSGLSGHPSSGRSPAYVHVPAMGWWELPRTGSPDTFGPVPRSDLPVDRPTVPVHRACRLQRVPSPGGGLVSS